MKINNVKLAKTKGIEMYEYIFTDKIHLKYNYYTLKEVANILEIESHETVRNAINSHKELFINKVATVGPNGKSTTLIYGETAIFLLALLLAKKSYLCNVIYEEVYEAYTNSKNKEAINDPIDDLKNSLDREEMWKQIELDITSKSNAPSMTSTITIEPVNDLESEIRNEKLNNELFRVFLERCSLLDIDFMTAATLIQKDIVLNNGAKINETILDFLYNRTEETQKRQRGILKETIEYLAKEKYDSNYEKAYHILSDKLKFSIGTNMQKIRKLEGKNKTSYLDMIIKEDAFNQTMEIISFLLES